MTENEGSGKHGVPAFFLHFRLDIVCTLYYNKNVKRT